MRPTHTLACLTALWACGMFAACSTMPQATPGSTAVSTPVSTADSTPAELQSAPSPALQGNAGDLVALVFISHECPIANAMVPDILDLANEARALGIRLYAVHAAYWVDDETIARHAREFALEGEVHVLADRAQSLTRTVGATVTPEGAVLRLDGRGGFERLYLGRVNDLYAAIGRRRAQPTMHDLRDAMRAAKSGAAAARPSAQPIGCFIEFAQPAGGAR